MTLEQAVDWRLWADAVNEASSAVMRIPAIRGGTQQQTAFRRAKTTLTRSSARVVNLIDAPMAAW